MDYNKDKAVKAIVEYVYFIENHRDKKSGEIVFSDDSKYAGDPERFDARRRQLHLAIASIFGLSKGSYLDYKSIIRFDRLDGWAWDNWLADGRKPEEYAEWEYWNIVDKLNGHSAHAFCNTLETSYQSKLRINDILRWTKKKVEKRMKPIDAVMDEYKRNLDAWNKDHHEKNHDEPYVYDRSNRHDYNGFTRSIREALHTIELFAEQPLEAYLAVAVREYLDCPIETVNSMLKDLEGLAFRAQEQYKTEPFYKYLEEKEKSSR